MTEPRKPDLRDQAGPRTSVPKEDDHLVGVEPTSIPSSGEPLRTPDIGHVPDGQGTKS